MSIMSLSGRRGCLALLVRPYSQRGTYLSYPLRAVEVNKTFFISLLSVHEGRTETVGTHDGTLTIEYANLERNDSRGMAGCK